MSEKRATYESVESAFRLLKSQGFSVGQITVNKIKGVTGGHRDTVKQWFEELHNRKPELFDVDRDMEIPTYDATAEKLSKDFFNHAFGEGWRLGRAEADRAQEDENTKLKEELAVSKKDKAELQGQIEELRRAHEELRAMFQEAMGKKS